MVNMVASHFICYVPALYDCSKWHECNWLSTGSKKSITILNIRATRASCRLFPELIFRVRPWSSDNCCRISVRVYRTVGVLQSCIYFTKKSTTIVTMTCNRAEMNKGRKSPIFIYFISFNLYVSGQNKKQKKKIAWLVADSMWTCDPRLSQARGWLV